MNEDQHPVTVSADDLHTWDEAVRRAEHGETVAVLSHGEHVADVVPSGYLDRMQETLEVLSDSDTVGAIREGLADLEAGRVVSAEEVRADLAARQGGQ